MNLSGIPIVCILWMSPSLQTLSYAFSKSKKVTMVEISVHFLCIWSVVSYVIFST